MAEDTKKKTSKKVEQEFTFDAVVRAEKYTVVERDLLKVSLSKDQTYTIAEADEILAKELKRSVE